MINFIFSDTITGIISVYDYDSKNRTITNKKDFAKFDRGYPDGSTVDADGFYGIVDGVDLVLFALIIKEKLTLS